MHTQPERLKAGPSRTRLFSVPLLVLHLALSGCALRDLRQPPLTSASTQLAGIPTTDPAGLARHEQLKTLARQGPADVIFLGDSITQDWEGTGRSAWNEYYAARQAINLGVGGDRVRNTLWRIEDGGLDGCSPRLVILLIGTNDLPHSPPDVIADEITSLVAEIQTRQPRSAILLLGLFPRERTPGRLRLAASDVNRRLARSADPPSLRFLDLTPRFLQPDGSLPPTLFPDGLHLSEEGYRLWAESMEPEIRNLLDSRPR